MYGSIQGWAGRPAYVVPEIRDYGTLTEVTASSTLHHVGLADRAATSVPFGPGGGGGGGAGGGGGGGGAGAVPVAGGGSGTPHVLASPGGTGTIPAGETLPGSGSGGSPGGGSSGGGGAGGGGGGGGGALPFTGLPALLVAAAGSTLAAGGVALRKVARRSSQR
jgi:hypothetical protein